MEENKHEMNKAAFAGIKFAFGFIKLMLAATTAISAYSLGRGFSSSLGSDWQMGIGILFAVFCSLGIDGGLDRFFKALLAKERPDQYFWIGAIVLTIGTGMFTWFSAAIIGDMEHSYITVDQHQRQVDEAREKKQSDLSAIASSIQAKQNKITALTYKMRKDTAKVLSTFRDSHRKLYESGQYKKYVGKSRYATLTASVNKLHDVMRPYEEEIARLKSSIAKMDKTHTEIIDKDVEASVSQSIQDHNERIARKESNRTGLVKFMDLAGVVFMWVLFWGLRKMKLKEKVQEDVEHKDLLKWAMDYTASLQKKILETDTGFSDSTTKALSSIIGFFNAILNRCSFTIDKASKFIDPTQKTTTTNARQLAATSSTTAPNISATNPRHSIGFRQNQGATSATKQGATNKGVATGQKPANPVGTSVAGDLSKTTKRDPVVYSGKSSGMTTKKNSATNQSATSIRVVNYIGEPHVIHNGVKRNGKWVKKQVRDYTRRLNQYKEKGKDTASIESNLKLFGKYLNRIEREKKSLL